jgi:hypothetical protein
MAVQMMAQVAKACGVEIGLDALRSPLTIRHLETLVATAPEGPLSR